MLSDLTVRPLDCNDVYGVFRMVECVMLIFSEYVCSLVISKIRVFWIAMEHHHNQKNTSTATAYRHGVNAASITGYGVMY